MNFPKTEFLFGCYQLPDFHDAYRTIGRFLEEVYTRKRIHSALGYLTPAEYEADWWARQSVQVLE